MAKARVRLKDLNNALRRLTNEVNKLRGRGANASAEKSLRTLHQSLSKAQKIMAAECPDSQFRNFDIVEGAAPRAKRAKKAARPRARKKAR